MGLRGKQLEGFKGFQGTEILLNFERASAYNCNP
jgi:hypothetical protein